MVNFNGNIVESDALYLNHENRGLRYGDALFETIRVIDKKIIFWEDHYLRLMASMRILRMRIPMNFTMEYLEEEILKTVSVHKTDGQNTFRIRLNVFRNNGGFYAPVDNTVSYIIEVNQLTSSYYVLHKDNYEVELFKDFYVNPDMLSNLKTNNKALNVVGSIFAQDNGYNNCILLNTNKQVVETLNGNLFLVQGNIIKTPPLKDGALNGILRKRLIAILKKIDSYSLEEVSISPFELQKVDEIFITNAIQGIVPITKYRKKAFGTKVAQDLIGKLNAAARLQ